jgi:hypothetical protein
MLMLLLLLLLRMLLLLLRMLLLLGRGGDMLDGRHTDGVLLLKVLLWMLGRL